MHCQEIDLLQHISARTSLSLHHLVFRRWILPNAQDDECSWQVQFEEKLPSKALTRGARQDCHSISCLRPKACRRLTLKISINKSKLGIASYPSLPTPSVPDHLLDSERIQQHRDGDEQQ